jgi:hypothetical protein
MLASGTFGGLVVSILASGTFGGLVVSMLASGTRIGGFKPGRSRRIFSGEKILSMPSFGREVKPFAPCGLCLFFLLMVFLFYLWVLDIGLQGFLILAEWNILVVRVCIWLFLILVGLISDYSIIV